MSSGHFVYSEGQFSDYGEILSQAEYLHEPLTSPSDVKP